ncbi:hypothetical protein C8Q79DRAFT_966951 [Trametes meyenii]|nr:hypothetical protein C8Q79DRAFT_966951 [Trametes meyenii]
MPPTRSQKNKTSQTKACEVCGKPVGTQGYTQHLRKCEKERRIELENKDFSLRQQPPLPAAAAKQRAGRSSKNRRPAYFDMGAETDREDNEHSDASPSTPQGSTNNPRPSPPSGEVATDSSRVERRLASEHPTTVDPFEDVTREYKPQSPQENPWGSFATKADFEFAKLSLEAALSQHQVDALLRLIGRLIRSEDRLTFRNQKDIQAAWEGASSG